MKFHGNSELTDFEARGEHFRGSRRWIDHNDCLRDSIFGQRRAAQLPKRKQKNDYG